MKPGERIRLIVEAAQVLEAMQAAPMQLMLRQHGATTYDDWEAGDYPQSTDEYLISRCETLTDPQLADLHTYLRGDEAAPAPQQATDRPWGSNPVAVFISHVHEDAVFASTVRDVLQKRWGIDAFVAHNDINPSKVWRNTIRSGLATCHFMVAMLHERFHASQWCDQEVGWAMGRNIPVMPVRFGPAPHRFDGFLEEYQDCNVDLSKGTAVVGFVAQTIFDAVLSDPRTHHVGVKALVEAFVNSRSFAQTDHLWAKIAAEPHWESAELRRLEYAVATNDQIYKCSTAGESVPDLVKALVLKFEPPLTPRQDPWSDEPPF